MKILVCAFFLGTVGSALALVEKCNIYCGTDDVSRTDPVSFNHLNQGIPGKMGPQGEKGIPGERGPPGSCQCPGLEELRQLVADNGRELVDLKDELSVTKQKLTLQNKAFSEYEGTIYELKEELNTTKRELSLLNSRPTSCRQIKLDYANAPSGVYRVFPGGESVRSYQIYCDMDDGEGWNVFQRRLDGSVEFYRGWESYVGGFGNKSGEFWQGLEAIHDMTNTGENYELKIQLEDFGLNMVYAHYSNFSVGAGPDYMLKVGSYSGNAGDSLTYHNLQKFSTYDRDQDVISTNCASRYRGAFWYKSCYWANLNGKYSGNVGVDEQSLNWYHWKVAHQSIKFSQMKFRPVA